MIKNLLIFGDSYSTHRAYIPEEFPTYYCDGGQGPEEPVTDMRWEQTWWGRLLKSTDAKLIQNNSWTGSAIGYTGYLGDCSKTSSFICRYHKLLESGFFDMNPIDTIIVFGGTNDSWCNAPLGEMQFADWKREDLFCVRPAICYFMAQLKQNHPNTRILFMVNCGIKQEVIRCVQDAAQHYEIECVALHNLDKIDGHPTVLGMEQIYDQLMQYLLRKESCKVDVIKDGVTDYVIVYDGAEESQAFADKLNALFRDYFGIELPVFCQKERKTTGKEILIGSSKEALSGLFDFAVTVEGNKLALCAQNALSYSFLLEYLKREIFKKAKCGQLTLTAADNIVYTRSALKEKNFIRYWLEENEKFPYGEHFAHKSHQHGEITIPYRIYIPFNYDHDKKYPLLLNLHGAGNRGSDNKRHLLFINRPLSNPALSVDEAIIIYPHCALENKWVHTNWYAGSYDLEQVPESEELKAVLEIVEQVRKTYSIDPKRMYLTGYSMGGYGTWNLLMNHPDLFAAAVPMCGAGDPKKAGVIKDIPIWAIHGAKDPVVPVKGSRDMAAALEKAGATKFRYTELPEVEHDAWNYTFNTPEIFRWLFSQQKQQ